MQRQARKPCVQYTPIDLFCTEPAHLSDLQAVSRGRWYVNNELIGVIKLKKYRTMAHRYGS